MLCNVVLLFSVLPFTLAETIHLFVSPTGSDSNDGFSTTKPLKTIQKAIDTLEGGSYKNKESYIELMQGYHDLTSTVKFHRAYTEPVTLRSYQNQEVHVNGGVRLSSDHFTKVTDPKILSIIPKEAHDKVRKINLRDVGVYDYGKLAVYGFYHQRYATLEIFINGKAHHLAEWPNKNYINIVSVPDGRDGTRFTYNSSRDVLWAKEKDPWVYGYWYWGWADYSARVTAIDPHLHQITLAGSLSFGIRTGSLRYDGVLNGYSKQGGYFRVINMLSELDSPGEFYLERDIGILYLWPNTPSGTLQQSDIIYVSMVRDCIQLDEGVANLRIEDFTLENCRHYGITSVKASNIKISNLEIKNTGSYGIICSVDCRSYTVSRCDIHDTDGGIYIQGGNRDTLQSSGNVLEDNHIWNCGRATQVGADAITPKGVGTLIRYNYFHDVPYTCVRWSGNDHTIEYNHFSRCCHDSSDCGAIHAGRDWSMRGNKIRYNYVHDTLRYWPGADVRGIMLDDEYSSVNIEHNVFYQNEVHTNIGGGRDNLIQSNLFHNATKYSIQVDGRGIGGSNLNELEAHLKSVPYTSPIWKARYPKLAAMAHNSSQRRYPEGNEIYKNIYYNEKGIQWIYFNGGGDKLDVDKYYKHHDNERVFSSTEFTSPETNYYQLQCAAKQWADTVNFPQPITFDKVGPRYPYGPRYINKGVKPNVNMNKVPPSSVSCVTGTQAPETDIPVSSYLPDGSSHNQLVTNITNEGCWLLVNSCPAHNDVHGTFRDSYGEQHEQAGIMESKCLGRAAEMWRYCGSVKDRPIYAVYGPTGAMTVGGDGCFFAMYGCDRVGSKHVGFERDNWAEVNDNAAHNEENCLKRAAIQWEWCGKGRKRTITSIYRPTGAVRTGGAGCWLKVTKCPADKTVGYYFYDSWGATNLGTDEDESECRNRAAYYWRKCGSHHEYPVTAYFRPKGREKTVP